MSQLPPGCPDHYTVMLPLEQFMFKCNVQSETMSREETAEAFQCCTTVCKAKIVSWGRDADANLLVQRKAEQNWGFLHLECVLSLQLCGVPLRCGVFSSL